MHSFLDRNFRFYWALGLTLAIGSFFVCDQEVFAKGRASDRSVQAKKPEVHIIFPSGRPHQWSANRIQPNLQKICGFIKKTGLTPILPKDTLGPDGFPVTYFSHTLQKRAHHLKEALLGSADIVWAGRGGYGCSEVLAALERENFTVPPGTKPKLIIGFSDITALHLWAARQGWVSWHGPVLTEACELENVAINGKTSLQKTLKIVQNPPQTLTYRFSVISPGLPSKQHQEATVVGGNLTLLETHVGTPTALDTTGKFIFFEDTKEDPKRFLRSLIRLLRAGFFTPAKALILGEMQLTGSDSAWKGIKTQRGRLQRVMTYFISHHMKPAGIDIPVIYAPNFGHGEVNDILPLNTKAVLDIQDKKAQLVVSTLAV